MVDMNPPGAEKAKAKCHLPIKEPKGGSYNRNGIHAAAAALAGARGGTKMPPAEKKKAAKMLVRLYREMGDKIPDSIARMAA